MSTVTSRLWRRGADGPLEPEPWHVVVVAAAALTLSGPGQTIGVSVFVDPMSEALDLTRSQVSGAYMVGTLLGSLAMPAVGRAIDRLGVRVVMAVVGAAFGLAAMAMAGVVGLVTVGVAFVGIRALGQGSLALTATTAVGAAFRRRRGLAVGLTVAVGTALMGLTPVALTAVIDRVGWRLTWVVAGATVALVVVPLGWFGLRSLGPTRRDEAGDGAAAHDGGDESVDGARPDSVAPGYTRGQAARTPLFWAITGATMSTAMIGTGMMFHQISLLGEQGLTAAQAATNFVPQSVATVTATLAAGWLADRWPPRVLIPLAMGVQITGMAMIIGDVVTPGWVAALYATTIGASAGLARAYEAAAIPRIYGVGHLGSVRGLVMGVNVASSSLGPILLALGFGATGSYATALGWLVVVPAATAALALVARVPTAPAGEDPRPAAGG